ncbi:transglutaminase family protein [Marinomonas sp. 15G1-11]|uniref:Transglutaminase family protein n=1 Tax=Marinomonas phaeophyticola TaxID=3004091 RepID=A0ABT4JVR7_9GAMM|nr:transglutaminase family protein [Marinomonas sp. 15G1-11]MCZ2722340.1 transglutaminase family protein [Marinomonas sp. 15G1-11]
MNFKIVHETTYLFSDKVFLEPHHLRFRPKKTPFINLTHFSIHLTPEAAGHKVIEDEEHNIVDFCWFEKLTSHLTLTVESHLQTSDYNPFDFIIYPDSFSRTPFIYSDSQYQILYAYLQKVALTPDLINYAEKILNNVHYNTIEFVTHLTSQIHNDFIVEYRENGPPLTPDATFDIKKGSCRDLSWMQISMLRHYGIASRFVSGYFYFETERPIYELHAWVEVFIPGIGWLGFDPSHGILTGNTHFSVASGATPENTMPVSGGLRGSATSTLSTTLIIERS